MSYPIFLVSYQIFPNIIVYILRAATPSLGMQTYDFANDFQEAFLRIYLYPALLFHPSWSTGWLTLRGNILYIGQHYPFTPFCVPRHAIFHSGKSWQFLRLLRHVGFCR